MLKHRGPEKGRYPDNPSDLEEAQQAMRIARTHAKEWHIAPDRIGVVGLHPGAGWIAGHMLRPCPQRGALSNRLTFGDRCHTRLRAELHRPQNHWHSRQAAQRDHHRHPPEGLREQFASGR